MFIWSHYIACKLSYIMIRVDINFFLVKQLLKYIYNCRYIGIYLRLSWLQTRR